MLSVAQPRLLSWPGSGDRIQPGAEEEVSLKGYTAASGRGFGYKAASTRRGLSFRAISVRQSTYAEKRNLFGSQGMRCEMPGGKLRSANNLDFR